ncbi:MAG: ABC transporter permease [Deinococcales bacterium]|nr:ABC transporter permease [Deinococcales bacterium]
MAIYLLRRLLTAVPIILLITAVVFAVMQILPGDPAVMLLGTEATEASLAATRERLGLNRPLHVQYLSWLGDVLRGDLGRSMIDNRPVTTAIANAFPVTLQIALISLVMALLVGVPAGIVSAVRRGGVADAVASLVALSGISLPGFWAALLLVYVFALQFDWLPSSGFVRPSEDLWGSFLSSLLPAVALGLRPAGVFMRLLRSSMLDVIRSDYVRTARAKGVGANLVVMRHALRNALVPLVTVLGVEFSALLGNVVVIDTIFAIPGFGRLIYNSFLRLDFVMMQSLLLLFALIVIAVNFLTDLSYSLLDPRIRYR